MGNIWSASANTESRHFGYGKGRTELFSLLEGSGFLPSKVHAEEKPSDTLEGNEDDDLDDPVERMLKKTGCLEKHYSVLECIAETKDWRQCQNQVKEFRDCMEKHKERQNLEKRRL